MQRREIPSCGFAQSKELKIPIRDYLASILSGLAELPVSRVAQITPVAWVAAN